jgi:DNA-binding NtrC family response regulator
MPNILVIDDDPNILAVIQTRLEANGYDVETRGDPLKALETLREREFDVIVTDVRMPQIDGMELLQRVHRIRWNIPVILLTAYGTIPNAVEAMKQGAFQYLTKPFQGKQLVEEIERALEERGKAHKDKTGSVETSFPGVYGVSAKMKALHPLLERIIDSESTVLIQGASGTGKELIAQMIHRNGRRKDNRFVIVDCGATPGTLIESELFGHAKGAFTNASEARAGMFELAHNGTLFLDEISSLPLDLQTRLLRVLEQGQIKRVGENLMRDVDVRVIAATNVDLNEQVETGAFRLDLYYRLAVLNLELPTLRQRKEDIPLLADFFLQNFSRKMKKAPMQWDEGVRDGLMQYDWPGNIRQLKNTIEAAVVLSQGKVLSLEDLDCAGLPKKPLAKVSQIDSLQDNGGASLPEFIERQEREMILEALEQNNWVQRGAAKQLGISPRVLNYKIKKLKIDPSSLNT